MVRDRGRKIKKKEARHSGMLQGRRPQCMQEKAARVPVVYKSGEWQAEMVIRRRSGARRVCGHAYR